MKPASESRTGLCLPIKNSRNEKELEDNSFPSQTDVCGLCSACTILWMKGKEKDFPLGQGKWARVKPIRLLNILKLS